jgi:hypothetical protein
MSVLASSIKSLEIVDGVLELCDGALAPHVVERLSPLHDNTLRRMPRYFARRSKIL